MAAPKIMWFRRDLRLADNEALAAACSVGTDDSAAPVIPVYVMDDETLGRGRGRASAAWLARSLRELDRDLRACGSRLVLLDGPAEDTLAALAAASGAGEVHCSRDWTPPAMEQEVRAEQALRAVGAALHAHPGQLLTPPEAVQNADGAPYRVFTPYYRRWLEVAEIGARMDAPLQIPVPDSWPVSLELPATGQAPERLDSEWQPGEAGALAKLERFVGEALDAYPTGQDVPAERGTSELSPHLAHGEISPGQVVRAVEAAGADRRSKDALVRQIAWRDFAYGILSSFPKLATRPWRPEFAAMPWRDDEDGLAAWREGRTGYPFVDAGMRQLAETGWMHNRARMVAGSFLAKHLLVPWQRGEEWFWDSLVDADPALNAFNWQWVAGSGADAAPYFRIFNPELQRRKFDSDGQYVGRWVRETMGDFTSDGSQIAGAGYPDPIIDHSEARERALAAYDVVKASKRQG